jgi:hypothetical protein
MTRLELSVLKNTSAEQNPLFEWVDPCEKLYF